jgi:hypothetical protein
MNGEKTFLLVQVKINQRCRSTWIVFNCTWVMQITFGLPWMVEIVFNHLGINNNSSSME